MHSGGADRYSSATRKQRLALTTAGDRGDKLSPEQNTSNTTASVRDALNTSRPPGVGFFLPVRTGMGVSRGGIQMSDMDHGLEGI